MLHQANDVLKARVQTAFLFKPRTSRESLRSGGKQAACKVSKNGSSKDCWRIVRVEKGLHFAQGWTLGLLLAKSKALACAILSLLWPFAELHPVSKSGNPVSLSDLSLAAASPTRLSKRATSNSVRAGSSSTLRGQENEANLCHISTLERAPLGPGKPLLHAQESSHYPWSCHAKPMTSTQSMHHKLPGSEILLRFKSKTSCCSVAVTTKQTRRCHRDGSFGTKRIKKTLYLYIIIILFYIYIMSSTVYHFTVSYGGRPAQLTATRCREAKAFSKKAERRDLDNSRNLAFLKLPSGNLT